MGIRAADVVLKSSESQDSSLTTTSYLTLFENLEPALKKAGTSRSSASAKTTASSPQTDAQLFSEQIARMNQCANTNSTNTNTDAESNSKFTTPLSAAEAAIVFLRPTKTFDKGNWKEQKVCAACCRPFTWRKKWERCWATVYTCSDRCKG